MGINAITMGIWAASAKQAITATDPYWSNVVLLLHGDTLTDSSPTPLTFTNSGVTVDTSTKKFGTGSLYLNGSSYAPLPSSADVAFGTGAFTIEFWCRRPSWASDAVPLSKWTAGGTGFLMVLANGAFSIYLSTFTPISFYWSAPAADTWVHLAMTRDASGNLRAFLNGTQIGSTVVNNASVNANYSPLCVGANEDGTAKLTGYIDDLRITKGVARYTANFTPPSAQFPDG